MRRAWHPSNARLAAAVLCAAALASGNTRPAAAAQPEDPATERLAPGSELDVSLESLQLSVHADLDCAACHVGTGDKKLSEAGMVDGEVQCLGCHEEAEQAYSQSVHAEARLGEQRRSARCQDCHGAHDVRAIDDAAGHTHTRRVAQTCAACHGNPELAEKLGIDDPDAFHTYRESIHGQVLLEKGTTVAPSCVSCHGSHGILEKQDPKSSVHPSNIGSTCGGTCHAGVERKLMASVHGVALADGGGKAPNCLDCHSTHAIEAKNESFKLQSDRRCGTCHEESFKQHLGTYHGRAHALGGSDVAACFDCHGSHEMRAIDDPESRLSGANKVETCRSCHEDAPAAFVTYNAHGDPGDKQAYPTLYYAGVSIRGALAVALALFTAHALMWLFRLGIAFSKNPRRFIETRRRRAMQQQREYPNRIRPIDKTCHALLLASFVLLIATGAPLRFHEAAWAQQFFGWLGGADVARALHRVGAILTLLYIVLHLSTLIARGRHRRSDYQDMLGRFRLRRFWAALFSEGSPLPNRSDLQQLGAHTKWFLGRGPEPELRRYNYWEKLDYIATFVAVVVIGVSGVVMWAPEQATHVLPGWMLNIAQLIHSEEALLAAVLVFAMHTLHILPSLVRRRPPPAPVVGSTNGPTLRNPLVL